MTMIAHQEHETMPANTCLTVREIEVARLVACGYSQKDIARDLTLSTKTVKNHIASIRQKWQCSNIALVAVKYVFNYGFPQDKNVKMVKSDYIQA